MIELAKELNDEAVLAMTACAQCYYIEYGTIPKGKEKDRYSTFKRGYEAGVKAGRGEERRAIMASIADRRALTDKP